MQWVTMNVSKTLHVDMLSTQKISARFTSSDFLFCSYDQFGDITTA